MVFFKGLITVFGIHKPCCSFKVKKKKINNLLNISAVRVWGKTPLGQRAVPRVFLGRMRQNLMKNGSKSGPRGRCHRSTAK